MLEGKEGRLGGFISEVCLLIPLIPSQPGLRFIMWLFI